MLDDDKPTTTLNTSAHSTSASSEPPAKVTRRRRATKASSAPASTEPHGDPAAPGADPTPGTAPGADPMPTNAPVAPGTDAAAGNGVVSAPAKKAVKRAPAKKAAPRKRAASSDPADLGPTTEQQPQDVSVLLALQSPAEPVVDAVEDEPAVEQATTPDLDSSPAAAAAEQEAAPTARRRTRAPAVIVPFQAPDAPAAPRRAPEAGTDEPAPDAEAAPRRRRRAGTAGALTPGALLPTMIEPVPAADDRTGTEGIDADPRDSDAGEDDDGPRRRRRGRRGRGRRPEGQDGAEDQDETTVGSLTGTTAAAAGTATDATTEDDEDDDEEQGEGAPGSATRRRRRRRRGAGTGGADEQDDDAAVPTVVHVREPRQRAARVRDGGGAADEDGVRGISGSTRMAAKRVRRQEGRDTGRKRAPIVSEAEFLARRESVDRQMVVRQKGDRTQIAVLEDGILVEHYVTKASATSYAGNVYLGKVQNVLPSMEAAFVDVGKGRNAVLYAGEVNYDGQPGGRSRSIESVLKSGQEVLVQVTKDPIGHKGARLTSQITLPGRYLVYVPEGSMTGISRKLPDSERARLKDILKAIVPEGAGVIIRTAAEGASEEEIAKDVRRLQAQWEVISGKAAGGGGPVLLHAEPDLLLRVVRDIFNEDFAQLTVSADSEWDTVREYVEFVAPDLAPRLSRWTSEKDVFAEHRIDEQLAKALDRKVHLPSGGSLVIDRTEAMVVIDVNTGKYVGKGGNLEETVTRNNLEAAEEIARQLRLRDLGGIIVVDFIDMVLESNRDLVVRRLVECLGRDRTKHQVAEVTSLGLVQMTRKRVGQGLLESFSEPCEHCHGRGVLVHTDPVDDKADRPERGPRERTPTVTPKAPKMGPSGPIVDRSAGVAAGSSGPADTAEGEPATPRPRRRRGGRGAGSAGSVTAAAELDELLTEPVVAAELEVAADAVGELYAAPVQGAAAGLEPEIGFEPEADPVDAAPAADPVDADPVDADVLPASPGLADPLGSGESVQEPQDVLSEDDHPAPAGVHGTGGAWGSAGGTGDSAGAAAKPRRRRAASRPAGSPTG